MCDCPATVSYPAPNANTVYTEYRGTLVLRLFITAGVQRSRAAAVDPHATDGASCPRGSLYAPPRQQYSRAKVQ